MASNQGTMSCQKCERLEKNHSQAEASLYDARARLEANSGASSRDEYQRLYHAVLASQERLNVARTALDLHIREHERQEASRKPPKAEERKSSTQTNSR
jgi:hypothetical protein